MRLATFPILLLMLLMLPPLLLLTLTGKLNGCSSHRTRRHSTLTFIWPEGDFHRRPSLNTHRTQHRTYKT